MRSLKFKEARFEDGVLKVKPMEAEDVYTARRLQLEDKIYQLTITEYKPKRSLNANGYAWVLIDAIAAALPYANRIDVYRDHIKAIGGVSEVLTIASDAVERFRKTWEGNGIGWQVDILGTTPDGRADVIAYYGSSTFDTAQMARFIDSLIEDCRALGIETMPPDKLEGLLNQWK